MGNNTTVNTTAMPSLIFAGTVLEPRIGAEAINAVIRTSTHIAEPTQAVISSALIMVF
jgi:hypothetical protein